VSHVLQDYRLPTSVTRRGQKLLDLSPAGATSARTICPDSGTSSHSRAGQLLSAKLVPNFLLRKTAPLFVAGCNAAILTGETHANPVDRALHTTWLAGEWAAGQLLRTFHPTFWCFARYSSRATHQKIGRKWTNVAQLPTNRPACTTTQTVMTRRQSRTLPSVLDRRFRENFRREISTLSLPFGKWTTRRHLVPCTLDFRCPTEMVLRGACYVC